jgi:hypothetical protein
VNNFMGVRDWAAESGLVRTALRALPPKRGSDEKSFGAHRPKTLSISQHSPGGAGPGIRRCEEGKERLTG